MMLNLLVLWAGGLMILPCGQARLGIVGVPLMILTIHGQGKLLFFIGQLNTILCY